jgi:hypothetical protein
MSKPKVLLVALGAVALLSGCGQRSGLELGVQGPGVSSAVSAGLPVLATKNTTRIAGADAVADAAAAAVAVYPGDGSRPHAVALADEHDWRAALLATELMGPPLRAPLLLTDGQSVPGPTSDALSLLRPSAVIRVGNAPSAGQRSAAQISGATPYALAANVAAYNAGQRSRPDNRIVIVSADAPQYAMPAAAWTAKSGDPILFVTRDGVPLETRNAIERLQHVRIYLLGPGSVISSRVAAQLRRLGPVKRIAGSDPATTAIEFARYSDGDFGWDVVNPGHGLVFANASDPLSAAAGAALSGSGTYGPLLVLDSPTTLPSALTGYLLAIEPGYQSDPSRGVYNHGWIIGDERAISLAVQDRIDALLEIAPVNSSGSP